MFEKLPLKQVLKIIKAHLLSSFLIFVLSIISVPTVYGIKNGVKIFAIIALLIYFAMMYNQAYEIADYDKKSYTKEEPYFLKGFFLAWGVTAITVILYIAYYFVCKYMKVDGMMTEVFMWILNLPFTLWSYAFSGIIGLEKGFMKWYGYIVITAVPIVFSGIGYIAGLKDFDITAKLSKYIYENKEKGNGKK